MAYCWQLNALDPTTIKRVIVRRGSRTVYELGFPLSPLRVEGAPGARLGFSLIVNENDTGAREGYLRWSDGIGNGKFPEEYGQLIFGR